jgi:hypothetical protein
MVADHEERYRFTGSFAFGSRPERTLGRRTSQTQARIKRDDSKRPAARR